MGADASIVKLRVTRNGAGGRGWEGGKGGGRLPARVFRLGFREGFVSGFISGFVLGIVPFETAAGLVSAGAGGVRVIGLRLE